MNPKSSGFTLIELLVVVAVIGILGAIGTFAYQGYISSTKKKTTINLMRQLILANTEYYSSNQFYYKGKGGTSCNPSISSSEDIEKKLLDEQNLILDPNHSGFKKANTGYLLCIADDSSNFKIVAQEQDNNTGNLDTNGCKITLTAANKRSYNNKC